MRTIRSAPRKGPAASASDRADADERGDAEPPPPDELCCCGEGAPIAERSSSSTTCATSDQRTASQSATGASTTCRVERDADGDGEADTPEEGARLPEREPVGAERAHRPTQVELDQGAGGRRLDERQPEERDRRSDRHHREHDRAGALAGRIDAGLDPEEAEAAQNERLEERDRKAEGQEDEPDPEEERRAPHVHPARGREDLSPGATPGQAKRGARPPGRARDAESHEREERSEREQPGAGLVDQASQRVRARRRSHRRRSRSSPSRARRRPARRRPARASSARSGSARSTTPSGSARWGR